MKTKTKSVLGLLLVAIIAFLGFTQLSGANDSKQDEAASTGSVSVAVRDTNGSKADDSPQDITPPAPTECADLSEEMERYQARMDGVPVFGFSKPLPVADPAEARKCIGEILTSARFGNGTNEVDEVTIAFLSIALAEEIRGDSDIGPARANEFAQLMDEDRDLAYQITNDLLDFYGVADIVWGNFILGSDSYNAYAVDPSDGESRPDIIVDNSFIELDNELGLYEICFTGQGEVDDECDEIAPMYLDPVRMVIYVNKGISINGAVNGELPVTAPEEEEDSGSDENEEPEVTTPPTTIDPDLEEEASAPTIIEDDGQEEAVAPIPEVDAPPATWSPQPDPSGAPAPVNPAEEDGGSTTSSDPGAGGDDECVTGVDCPGDGPCEGTDCPGAGPCEGPDCPGSGGDEGGPTATVPTASACIPGSGEIVRVPVPVQAPYTTDLSQCFGSTTTSPPVTSPPTTPAPFDACPNLPGDQASVPSGHRIDPDGNCKVPEPTVTTPSGEETADF